MKSLALPDVTLELSLTRRILERVPEEHFDWKPHEKSWTLGELATHIAGLLGWTPGILEQDEFDLATIGPPREALNDRDELLEMYDRLAEALQEGVNDISEEDLKATWTIRTGDQVINQLPRLAAVRTTILSHLIHHRGQLTVYLRLLDVPLPPIYGPTADEGASWTR